MQQSIGKETGKGIWKVGDTSWGTVQEVSSGLTHGDDFVVTRSKASLLELKKQWECKSSQSEHHRGKSGKEHQGAEPQSLRVWGSRNGNTVQTSTVDDMKDENPVQLDPDRTSRFSSHVARCLFLSRDRADIIIAVNELCQKMSDPAQPSLAKLNQLARYSKGERQCIQVCKFGDMSSDVTFSRTRTRGTMQSCMQQLREHQKHREHDK